MTSSAHAQWQWLDDADRKVFSDRPPPPHVPAHKVLQTPHTKGYPLKNGSKPNTSAEDAIKIKATASNTADGEKPSANADIPPAKPEKSEQEVKDAQEKLAQEQKQARLRQENCTRARSAQALMQSGQMLSHVNAKGERGFLDEATRQQELGRLKEAITSNCG